MMMRGGRWYGVDLVEERREEGIGEEDPEFWGGG